MGIIERPIKADDGSSKRVDWYDLIQCWIPPSKSQIKIDGSAIFSLTVSIDPIIPWKVKIIHKIIENQVVNRKICHNH